MSITKNRETIRRLLAQADDQAGTPEGEAFRAKALQLMGRYQISEADARQTAQVTREAGVVTIRLRGQYLPMQLALLNNLANTMHCRAIQIGRGVAEVFGVEQHREDVAMLFGYLNTHMILHAASARPDRTVRHSGELRVYRRSWMSGFIKEVCTRIAQAQNQAAQEARQQGSSQALVVLRSDADLADRKMRETYPHMRVQTSRRQSNHSAEQRGRAAGRRVDLGGGSLAGGRAALQ